MLHIISVVVRKELLPGRLASSDRRPSTSGGLKATQISSSISSVLGTNTLSSENTTVVSYAISLASDEVALHEIAFTCMNGESMPNVSEMNLFVC